MSEHHHHDHGTEQVSDTVLLWTTLVNIGLSVFEFIAGAIAGSVALMADALHNTNDAAALLIAYIARKVSRKGADKKFTFGYRRAELIGAMIQLTALVLVGLYLIYEATKRFFSPEPLEAGWIMAAAGVALFVDVVTAWLLWSMSKGSMNLKAAFLHNLTDAGASVAVLVGGATIYFWDWDWVDPILTLLIAGYILYMSIGMLRTTCRILMEGAPPDLSMEQVQATMMDVPGVEGIHHLHVWELDEHHQALEAHVVVKRSQADHDHELNIRRALKQRLQERHSIQHCTLELEYPGDPCGSSTNNLIEHE
ncbi:cation diffusion facilitator family transporter [Cerasicoccus fimbriatus]|uniref:cation diffusion facilitator family transporter n=1 Tax=Cerasicoccus fimbriatus TaxID=3014554 RepID=UPI0022B4DE9A|nr:cation diffusion facilitator family transporter [Cerasicoccus sp. TK19100]